MAISGPGVGAAAGTVGQLLMQHALQKQEREEREQARQQAMVPRMLQVMAGRDERIAPLEAGAPLPERGRELTVGDQRFAAIAPPPEQPKPPSVTMKRPGFQVTGTPDQVTQALPGLPVLPPEPPTFEVGGRAFPETPEGQQAALAWERQLSAAGRSPQGVGQLPFRVSTGGIEARAPTAEEALKLRERLQLAGGGGEAEGLAQNAAITNRVLNEIDEELTKVIPGIATRGGLMGGIANIFTGERAQQAAAAADNFSNAAVRYLSGKGMSQQEREGYRRALTPQIGDKPGTIQLKRAMREALIQAMRSGEWRGQIGPNGEPDIANLETFIAQFQAENVGGDEDLIGADVSMRVPDIGLSGPGRSLTPAIDAFTDTTATPQAAGATASSDEITAARQFIQGMPPDRASAALSQAGFSPAEISQILGS